MQIPCSDASCFYQEYGECMLSRVTAGQSEKNKCSYYRSKKEKML